MPFIKKDMRPPFNEVLHGLKLKQEEYMQASLEIALDGIKWDSKKIDGCINYLFSKLLKREQNPHVWKPFIKDVINRVYFPENYEKLNRLMGLLTSMIGTFKAFSWGNDDDTTDMLEGLRRHYNDKVLIPYERKKRKENGDI